MVDYRYTSTCTGWQESVHVPTIAVGIKRATVKDLLSVNKVLNQAQPSKLSKTFQHLGSDNDLSLRVFTDAALGNLLEGGSQVRLFLCTG